MNHHRATALLAAASLLALAGCGSSSNSGAKATATATSASASATTTTPATSAPATSAPATSAPAASATPPPSSAAPVPAEPDAKTTITVDCEPAKTQKQLRADWEADVKTFQKAHPLITIKSVDTDPCVNPATWNAKLKAGQVANVFYTYNTDAQDVINKGQALNIQSYASTIPGLSDVIPAVKAVWQKGGTADGDLFGLPRKNYTLGLVYNRDLFTKAGLDPNSPPTTWDEVIADAKKIAALGKGYVGYADYSAGNTGGWHFTAEMYSQGGDITADGKTADFNNDKGTAVLNNLHQMRWVDNSMGTKQLLGYDDLNQMMAAGKLGMHIGAPDQVQRDHDNFKASYSMIGMGPMPGGASTLLGGDGYLFNVKDTPDQVKAGLLWLEFQNLTPGQGQFNYARASAEKAGVGLPEPAIWTGAFAAADTAAKDKYRTIPAENFAPYVEGTPKLKGNVEPPNAQAVYADLDKVMSEVLTKKNADIAGLLKSHAASVSKLLVAAPKPS
ncbi:MAG: multiple sugar transport system substrate-binding protein [Frankiales bacterium]|nr:multiple sugar transport system substrate-binding protein [Frankiales bacterium]